MEEIWKDIEGYEGLYQVSNLGNVRSVDKFVNARLNGILTKRLIKGKNIKLYMDKEGRYIVKLSKNSKRKNYKVHRLVAIAFISNPNNYPYINHKDENPKNNRVDNLEWCTAKYNSNYGTIKDRIAKASERKIIQYTLDNKFIQEWESMTKAQNKLNIPQSNISACCRKIYKQAGGYIWKYKED